MNTSTEHVSTDNPFWQYSLRIYRHQQVQQLCLQMQDDGGGNVNLLLWASWLASLGRGLTPALLADTEQRLQCWEQEVVGTLRQLRQFLKQGHDWPQSQVETTRQAIKLAELKAEQQEQAWLYQWAANAAEDPVAAQGNVERYVTGLALADKCSWLASWKQALAEAE